MWIWRKSVQRFPRYFIHNRKDADSAKNRTVRSSLRVVKITNSSTKVVFSEQRGWSVIFNCLCEILNMPLYSVDCLITALSTDVSPRFRQLRCRSVCAMQRYVSVWRKNVLGSWKTSRTARISTTANCDTSWEMKIPAMKRLNAVVKALFPLGEACTCRHSSDVGRSATNPRRSTSQCQSDAVKLSAQLICRRWKSHKFSAVESTTPVIIQTRPRLRDAVREP